MFLAGNPGKHLGHLPWHPTYLCVTWEPRKLDMVSSRFCRRSSTFCTVLFLWDSGSGERGKVGCE